MAAVLGMALHRSPKGKKNVCYYLVLGYDQFLAFIYPKYVRNLTSIKLETIDNISFQTMGFSSSYTMAPTIILK